MPPSSPNPPPRVPSWLPSLLGYFIAVGPAATDMYLPAFPAVEHTFGTAPGTAQFTLATWFAGLAVGQITMGTLSDRFGRRTPLIFGTATFTLAAIGCALAPSLTWLAIFRAVAAIGASAGMVVPRAMVRDLAEGHHAAIMMSRLTLVMGVAPILAPSIGGAVLTFAHWRVIFWILALYGAGGCAMAWRLLPETLPPDRRTVLHPTKQLERYAGILHDPGFLSHAAMGAGGSFCMFAYLAGSSPVFILGFGLAPWQFALIFGLCSCGLIAGSQINARLLPKVGLSFMLRVISRISLAATATLTALAFAGVHVLPVIVAPIFVALSCQGFSNGNTTAGALQGQARHAGSASALMGVAQYTLGATSGLLVGVFTDGTPRGMAALMLIGALGMVVADLTRPRT
jgi:DHA1 family bicyclomycin/chloramphenicol resistance-like MFS transporter